MKLKTHGLAALSMGLIALSAGSASATTLEVGGVTQNTSVSFEAHIENETLLIWARTDGSLANGCAASTVAANTSPPFSASVVTGAVVAFTFGSCNHTVHVHKTGQLYVENISGTTNGTVYSENTEITVTVAFGNTVNCQTKSGTDIGKLTGVASGTATVDVDAVLNCGFLAPSVSWKGSYTVTGALGVSA